MHKFKIVRLHLLDPPCLPMGEMQKRVLKQIPEWYRISMEDEVAITEPKLLGLRYCHYYC